MTKDKQIADAVAGEMAGLVQCPKCLKYVDVFVVVYSAPHSTLGVNMCSDCFFKDYHAK